MFEVNTLVFFIQCEDFEVFRKGRYDPSEVQKCIINLPGSFGVNYETSYF